MKFIIAAIASLLASCSTLDVTLKSGGVSLGYNSGSKNLELLIEK